MKIPDDVIAPREYSDDVKVKLQTIMALVRRELKNSQMRMKNTYDTSANIKYYNIGDKVWLRKKFYKAGENRKLSPRRTGPWTVTAIMGNGIDFGIKLDGSLTEKVVHHNRLMPVKKSNVQAYVPTNVTAGRFQTPTVPLPEDGVNKPVSENDTTDSEHSINEDRYASDEEVEPRYPVRQRPQRVIPGAIPWDAIDLG